MKIIKMLLHFQYLICEDQNGHQHTLPEKSVLPFLNGIKIEFVSCKYVSLRVFQNLKIVRGVQ